MSCSAEAGVVAGEGEVVVTVVSCELWFGCLWLFLVDSFSVFSNVLCHDDRSVVVAPSRT